MFWGHTNVSRPYGTCFKTTYKQHWNWERNVTTGTSGLTPRYIFNTRKTACVMARFVGLLLWFQQTWIKIIGDTTCRCRKWHELHAYANEWTSISSQLITGYFDSANICFILSFLPLAVFGDLFCKLSVKNHHYILLSEVILTFNRDIRLCARESKGNNQCFCSGWYIG